MEPMWPHQDWCREGRGRLQGAGQSEGLAGSARACPQGAAACSMRLQVTERLAETLDEKAEVEAQLRAARERTEGAGLSAEALRQQLAAAQKELEAQERAVADAVAALDAKQAELDELRRGAAAGDETRGGLAARVAALEAQLASAKVRWRGGAALLPAVGQARTPAITAGLAVGCRCLQGICGAHQCKALLQEVPCMHLACVCNNVSLNLNQAAGGAGCKGCLPGGARCRAGDGRAGGRGQGPGGRGRCGVAQGSAGEAGTQGRLAGVDSSQHWWSSRPARHSRSASAAAA